MTMFVFSHVLSIVGVFCIAVCPVLSIPLPIEHPSSLDIDERMFIPHGFVPVSPLANNRVVLSSSPSSGEDSEYSGRSLRSLSGRATHWGDFDYWLKVHGISSLPGSIATNPDLESRPLLSRDPSPNDIFSEDVQTPSTYMWEQSDATTKSGPVNERSLDFSYWQKLHTLSGTMGIASSLPTTINL